VNGLAGRRVLASELKGAECVATVEVRDLLLGSLLHLLLDKLGVVKEALEAGVPVLAEMTPALLVLPALPVLLVLNRSPLGLGRSSSGRLGVLLPAAVRGLGSL